MNMTRRGFLEMGAGAAALASPSVRAIAAHAGIPIIDTHIHLFDPTRPQGVPWPEPQRPDIYLPALPARYRAMAEPYGVRGAIEVECSPWLEDNQWGAELAGDH
jgi:L-fuconolactonase